MNAFTRTVLGGCIGAIFSFASFFILGGIAISISEARLNFFGETGGNIVLSVIGFVVGAFLGCLIGFIQPIPQKATKIALYILGLFMVIQALYFFFSADFEDFISAKKYGRIAVEISYWFLIVAVFTFEVKLISKVVASPKNLSKIETN